MGGTIVYGCNVTLEGTVAKEVERCLAESIVRADVGTLQVPNKLVVGRDQED